ncbi:MAG: hypothetical protein HC771_13530 [Synechococcales cyanobacterium CRU_2_2]|nr:hypothetical protein [Synechococcales cyanobacterium CRU_2_2]
MSDSQNTPQETDSTPETTAPGAIATPDPAFGWNAYAERTNGRFAMVGFVALLLLESVTRQDFWTWIGF